MCKKFQVKIIKKEITLNIIIQWKRYIHTYLIGQYYLNEVCQFIILKNSKFPSVITYKLLQI